MDDFDKLKEALEKGKFVALDKGENGSIQFGRSFEYHEDLECSKYCPDNPEDMSILPEHVFVLKKNFRD